MTYVALLRGINVGGNNKVDMKVLKAVFEKAGMDSVKTYINTGNVIFQNTKLSKAKIEVLLENAITTEFGLSIKVLLKSINEIKTIVEALPDSWKNDSEMKCDVLFLWEEIDSEDILKQLPHKPEIEEVRYISGAILWCVKKENVTKSGLIKLIGTKLYKQMTIRNCNTARKIFQLM